MPTENHYSFDEFCAANAEKVVSGLDYVRSIYKSLALPADFVVLFSRIYKPELRLEQGYVFIADLFDGARFADLLQSSGKLSLAQYWMNLLEVTGLFDGLSIEQATGVAHDIADAWNSRINSACPDALGRASVIHDQSNGEVFVTVGRIE